MRVREEYQYWSWTRKLPTVNVELLDWKISVQQKKRLAESLTETVTETLGYVRDSVVIVFKSTASDNVARAGVLGHS